jgi:RNA polymerase sigma-70 factor, ECF subfamily
METIDKQVVKLLKERNEAIFKQVFKDNFKNLQAYAVTIVNDMQTAEEIVQQVFFKIWDRTDNLNIEASLAAYLYRAVYNESCNYLKHVKVKRAYQQHTIYTMHNMSTEKASKKVLTSELEKQISVALNELPEQCRTVFQLSRFESLKYQQIASKLNISIKTVEAHMGKALKLMRIKLVDYLPFLFILINF